MLSGIKTGKRKRPAAGTASSAARGGPGGSQCSALGSAAAVPSDKKSSGDDNNRSAADALRMSLLGGGGSGTGVIGTAARIQDDKSNDIQSRLDARMSSYKNNESTIHNLQSRGRISSTSISATENNDDTIVINPGDVPTKSTIQYENEHKLRYNSRGKLSRHAHEQLRSKTEEEMTIEQMAAHERQSTLSNSNMDEVYARNIIKMGKSYNKLDKIMGNNSKSGADEEDMQQTSTIANLYRSNDDKYSPAELASRSKSRQIAHHDALSKWTSKSWWWMESPKFDKRYLIALGNKCSLVMTPSHKRLQQHAKKGVWTGGQCYIVPLPYAESFVSLDEDTWYEVNRFQRSLQQLFHRENRGVIFLETVTRTSNSSGGSGSGGSALQAKMEVIPVPLSVERDAPLYFRSGLAEVAQEWGTHSRPVKLDGQKKTLRNAVPKRGFPYFYCGWGDCGKEGYVQLIENEDDGDDYTGHDNNAGGYAGGGGMRSGGGSKKFPRDFGVDTIGGMMDCDPVRFQRKVPAKDGDRAEILQFCEKWKEFDWTLELDG